MARKLRTVVYVEKPDSSEQVAIKPGEDVPDWAVSQITNPMAWAEDDDAPAPTPTGTNPGEVEPAALGVIESPPVLDVNPAAVDPSEVPSGSVDDVLAWVGDDTARAQAALDFEQAGRQRKGVIEPLTALVEG